MARVLGRRKLGSGQGSVRTSDISARENLGKGNLAEERGSNTRGQGFNDRQNNRREKKSQRTDSELKISGYTDGFQCLVNI
jgi:hypothetical protein